VANELLGLGLDPAAKAQDNDVVLNFKSSSSATNIHKSSGFAFDGNDEDLTAFDPTQSGFVSPAIKSLNLNFRSPRSASTSRAPSPEREPPSQMRTELRTTTELKREPGSPKGERERGSTATGTHREAYVGQNNVSNTAPSKQPVDRGARPLPSLPMRADNSNSSNANANVSVKSNESPCATTTTHLNAQPVVIGPSLASSSVSTSASCAGSSSLSHSSNTSSPTNSAAPIGGATTMVISSAARKHSKSQANRT
jgi:hypothetical protein